MKTILAFTVLMSALAFAQMPSMPQAATFLKEKTAKVMKVCAEDKKKIKGCDNYTELAPLKDCLLKNKDALSAPCKAELTSK